MECAMGALNSKGFQSKLTSGQIPQADHITYEGVFNELTFKIGPRAKNPLELHLGFCRSAYSNSLVERNPSDFLAIFLKGSKDGQPRDERTLNSIIILDISGSMSGGLSNHYFNNVKSKSRLDLSKQAIKMFISKLKKTDSFGLVIFNSGAQILIPCQRIQKMDFQLIFQIINGIETNGGTNLSTGIKKGAECLDMYLQKMNKDQTNVENRLIMLTDVCDNNGPNYALLQSIASKHIYTTIIGISDEFLSESCQKLKDIKGFNYFCAVEDQDLKKYLFENFDYTFFPSNFNISLMIQSENIKCFEVFGSPDSNKVKGYNNNFSNTQHQYIISHINTSFPSELVFNNNEVQTHGGLILVKIKPKQNSAHFNAKILLKYQTCFGQKKSEVYDIKYQTPINQQFYSQHSLEEASRAYYFVSQIKQVLNQIQQKNYKGKHYEQQIKCLQKLIQLAPEKKKEEVTKLIQIIKGLNQY